ncbi:MAG TPA: transposase [Polyangiaceae bacterium]
MKTGIRSRQQSSTGRTPPVPRRGTRAGQLSFGFPTARDGTRRGGARRGAGRKRLGPRQCTPHRARPPHRAAEPVHVTLRAALAPLRSQFLFPTVRLAISRANRRAPERFRVVEFSVQRDHVHLVVEAASKRELSSGVRSVAIRVARYVNDLLTRRGKLWADRWHGRALRSPREVRRVLAYVLTNFRKHGGEGAGIDPYSSGGWFEGWREWRPSSGTAAPFAARPPPGVAAEPRDMKLEGESKWRPTSRARTWLAVTGWRRHGLIRLDEAPAPERS